MIEEYKLFKNTFNPKNGRGSIWEVSNQGNVKRNGQKFVPYLHGGYLCFCGGCSVHRAVAELFIPNPENKPTVDHIDRNIYNNTVPNLRWATYSEQNVNRVMPPGIKRKCGPKSEETKRKISEANKGKKGWNKGGTSGMKGKPSPIRGKHKIYNDPNNHNMGYHYE